MVVLQQLNLSIEESHNANDGSAKGGGEKHFVEHLFLLFSGLVLGQMVRFCSSCHKPDWSDNRLARLADQIHCTAIVLSEKVSLNRRTKALASPYRCCQYLLVLEVPCL